MAKKEKNVPTEEQQEEKTTFKGFIMGLLAFTIVILIGVVLVNTALVNLGLMDPKHGIVNQVMAILPFGDKETEEGEVSTFIETEANAALIQNTGSFGVFIGIDGTEIARTAGYDLIVIDAQGFSAEQIAQLKSTGVTVISYLNVGSMEQSRPYYGDMSAYSLGPRDDWPDEVWMDVSNPEWQNFVCGTLAQQLYDKGVDGFFIDNTDVYAAFPTDEMYGGLLNIMNNLQGFNVPIIINGGDVFVSKGLSTGELTYLIEAVCQEDVFTTYDRFKGYSFQNQTDTAYYKNYIESCAQQNLLVYLIEYAPDPDTAAMISEYCNAHNFQYYISDSIELN
ncbi:MAG: endo alpha-1,4 polygalactosaminidase [Lachnospiraceae bacterium]|nr:endo alpha-1,4 polygalactosaminidase [Lachnospiraceae bacterium]